jgi:hypothetical protein
MSSPNLEQWKHRLDETSFPERSSTNPCRYDLPQTPCASRPFKNFKLSRTFGLFSQPHRAVIGTVDGNAEVDLLLYTRYVEAEKLAKVLLENLGMPDVAYGELKLLKRQFACGRCDQAVMTWESAVCSIPVFWVLSLTNLLLGRASYDGIVPLGGREGAWWETLDALPCGVSAYSRFSHR